MNRRDFIRTTALGAAALGDIGKLFPDTSDEWKGADSKELLRIVMERVREKGWEVSNVDVTIALQAPKIGPLVPRMRDVIASVMDIEKDQVSVKATTEEGLGFTGAGEGIAAQAVCLITEPEFPEFSRCSACGGCPRS